MEFILADAEEEDTSGERVGFILTWTKRAPHVSHLYGFSPEWMRV